MGALFSLEHLEATTQGNQQLIVKLLRLFADTVPGTVKAIKMAFEQNRLTDIHQLAHKIKSGIDTLGIESIQQEIRLIEKWPAEKGCNSELEALIHKVDTVVQEVAAAIKTSYPVA